MGEACRADMPGQASMEDMDVAWASESEGGLGVLQRGPI